MEGFHPNRSCKHGMSKFTITVTGVILCLWFAQCRFKKKKRERQREKEALAVTLETLLLLARLDMTGWHKQVTDSIFF